MEDGAIKGIFIGIALIVVAAVIGIAVALFSTSKETSNNGNVQVQGALGTLSASVYSDYDQKTVVGSQVSGAYSNFNGKTCAIVVKTCKGSWVNYNSVLAPFTVTSFSMTTPPFAGFTKTGTAAPYDCSESVLTKQKDGTTPVALVLNASGKIVTNANTAALFKSGDVNYVASTSLFNSFLIRDAADDVVGICFVQQGKHTTT